MVIDSACKRFQSPLPVKGATEPIYEPWHYVKFQSPLPVKGATTQKPVNKRERLISIPAPREGSDLLGWLMVCTRTNFNPRSP